MIWSSKTEPSCAAAERRRLRPVPFPFLIALAVLTIGGVQAAPRDGSAMRFPSGATFVLEIAVSDEDRGLGYMFRPEIPADEGMLFVMGRVDRHGFWMKNCLTALDIIWLDEEYTVVHIEERVPPCPPEGECPLVRPMQAASYVLEVAPGRAAEENLAVGDRLERIPGAQP